MVRDASRAAPLTAAATVVEGDVTRPDALPAALDGVDAVVHCAAITGDRKEPYRGAYDDVNRRGTEHLVEAARRAGVRRIVLQSGLGTVPGRPGSYMATRWGMEEAVRGSGLAHVILQPSVLFGAGAPFVRGLAGVIRTSPVVPLIGGPFQPLWVEDMARCLEAAIEDDALTGATLALGGPRRMSMRAVAETIAGGLGVRRAYAPVPLAVAAAQARLMAAVLPRPPLTPATIELFGLDNTTAEDSVRRAFGFPPRDFADHVREHGLELAER
jgi:NADH dehydrogenase